MSPRLRPALRRALVPSVGALLVALLLALGSLPADAGRGSASPARASGGASAGAAAAALQAPSDVQTCADDPSSCGYPDADNTGPRGEGSISFVRVPQDRTSGPGWEWNDTYATIFVSGAGAVLKNLEVSGSVVIDAPHVTLKDSRISACGGDDDNDAVAVRYQPGSSYRGADARILRNVIQGTPAGCDHRARSGVRDFYGRAPHMLVSRNDISGSGNGVTMEYDGVARNNWVHDLGHIAEDHHSGLSNHGGARHVVFRHNTALLFGASYPGGGGLSGALTVYSDFDHAQNVTLEDNLVSGGSFVIYGGNSGDEVTTESTNIKIRGNRFVCGDWLYGAISFFDVHSAGNEWQDNYCDGSGKKLSWH